MKPTLAADKRLWSDFQAIDIDRWLRNRGKQKALIIKYPHRSDSEVISQLNR
jgi:hypothetical protein